MAGWGGGSCGRVGSGRLQCHSGSMSATVPPPTLSTTELLRWVFERLNDHDTQSLRAIWTPATVDFFPDAMCTGEDEIAAYFEDKFAAVEGFHLDPVVIVADGDDALVHWRMTGRHVGPLLGVDGTGRPIALDGIDHFVLREGVVIENTVVFDQLSFARQVGLLPADRSAPDRALKGAFNARTRLVAAVRRARGR